MALPATGGAFLSILCPRVRDGLPLNILNRVGPATRKRNDMIANMTGTVARRPACRRARMLPLEFLRAFARSMLARRNGICCGDESRSD